ncbi:MAG: amidase family protein, partial [Methyloligellaceae bacterium]
HGPHAASIEDMWQVAIKIARRTGGDPGRTGLFWADTPPKPAQPERLIVLETAGWAELDGASRSAFEAVCRQLADAGIGLLRRGIHAFVEELEHAIADAADICGSITSWENRWVLRNLIDQHPDGVSERTKATVARAEAMTPDDYRLALLKREQAQLTHRSLAGAADAVITLSCPGPAPLWQGDVPGEPLASHPTGNAIFNYPSSMLFAPVVSVPLMSVGGLPVGVQIMGQQHADARVTALARWMGDAIAPAIEG